jgi:hypothetical protein
MDRDLALKFIKDKEREIEVLCNQLGLTLSSSLEAVTHESVSGTHDLREDSLMNILNGEYLGL